MSRKLLVFSVLVIFLLVAISFTSTINSSAGKTVRSKESPLFRIRIIKAIRERVGDFLRRFVGERVFFLPFQWLKKFGYKDNLDLTLPGTRTCPPKCEI